MTLKLSDAMQLGSMIRPKSNGFFFKDGASCAQGAALEAVGIPYDERTDGGTLAGFHLEFSARWAWTDYYMVQCPACGATGFFVPPHSVHALIPHLNNTLWGHGWSRERIADWIASIEREVEALGFEATQAEAAVDPPVSAAGATDSGTPSTRVAESSSSSSSPLVTA